MFDVDNFEFEFDDDFSTNIFNKHLKEEKTHTLINEPKKLNNLDTCTKKAEALKRHVESNENQVFETQNKKLRNDVFPNSCINFSNSKKDENDMLNCISNLKRPKSPNEKISKKKVTHEGLVQRKFPGPAGLLPDKPFREIEEFSIINDKSFEEEDDEKEKHKPIIYSQSSGSIFLESAYQKLVSDFELNLPENPLSKHTVEWLKKTAMSKTLNGRKIPFLALVLHSINHNTPDPVLLLRDPTGEIHGTLHREVWAELGGILHTGIALALRQVGVLITGVIRRQIYLNITTNNILALYSPAENEYQVEVTTVNKVSKADLLKSIQSWKAQGPGHASPAPSLTESPRSLFSSITDFESPMLLPPQTSNEEIKNRKNKCQSFRNMTERETNKKRKNENLLEDLGIVFADGDFNDDLIIPQNNLTHKSDKQENPGASTSVPRDKISDEGKFRTGSSSQVLSQAETLIFEEVLSGIDLDEFEM